MVTRGLGSGRATDGASLFTIGAGAGRGAGTALGRWRLTIFFFAFGIISCWGAGSATAGDCSAMTIGAGAVTISAAGAGGVSAATSTGAGAATGSTFGLVAQADKAKAVRNKITGMTTLSVLDMAFSRGTVGDIRSRRNLPTVIKTRQTIQYRFIGRKNHSNLMQAVFNNPAALTRIISPHKLNQFSTHCF